MKKLLCEHVQFLNCPTAFSSLSLLIAPFEPVIESQAICFNSYVLQLSFRKIINVVNFSILFYGFKFKVRKLDTYFNFLKQFWVIFCLNAVKSGIHVNQSPNKLGKRTFKRFRFIWQSIILSELNFHTNQSGLMNLKVVKSSSYFLQKILLWFNLQRI